MKTEIVWGLALTEAFRTCRIENPMSGDECVRTGQLANNPGIVSLLLVYEDDGEEVIAMALLWNCESGAKVMDYVWYNNRLKAKVKMFIDVWARVNGYIRVVGVDMPPELSPLEDGSVQEVRLPCTTNHQAPFMGVFRFGNSEGRCFSNKRSLKLPCIYLAWDGDYLPPEEFRTYPITRHYQYESIGIELHITRDKLLTYMKCLSIDVDSIELELLEKVILRLKQTKHLLAKLEALHHDT